jgi:hypothetical protein
VDENVIQHAHALRADGLAPKAIARTLGIGISEVTAALNAATPVPGTNEPRCWINTGWSHRVDLTDAPHWAAHDRPTSEAEEVGGLASILVARDLKHTNKALVVGFLLDTWCLGVKNALPADPMTPTHLAEHRHAYFSAHQAHRQIPAALARDLVFGAETYARTLGFQPNEDFEEAAAVLGESDQPSPIHFGRDGKPFYVNGPYDHPSSVLATLNRTVGKGNYDYAIIGAAEQPRRRPFGRAHR